MKKVVAIALILILLLAGCSKDEPLVTESKTFYFTQFGVLDGKDAAVVAIVENIDGEYVDTSREETLSFADDALIESFDLRRTSAPTETSIEKMELEQFKEASLLFNGNSPVIYRAEIADAVIYSLRSELKFLPVNEPADKLCPDCDKLFKEGIEFETHACRPEPSPTPAPTPTPAPVPVPAGSPGSKACPVCTEWYAEGNDYLYHECVGYSVMCPLCGNWYEAGYDFLTHPCAYITPAPTASSAPVSRPNSNKTTNTSSANSGPGSIQCPVCTNWYAEGDTYLHHECVGYSVMCPLCGDWYEAGYDILTHPCATGDLAPPVVRDRWQCQICGNWYDPGYNHSHTPLPGTVAPTPVPTIGPNQVVCPTCYFTFNAGYEYDTHECRLYNGIHPKTCPSCGLSFPGDQLKYHNCQAPPPIICPDCGDSFVGIAYDYHICPNRVQMDSCFNCGASFPAGDEFRAHTASCTATPPPVICGFCGATIPEELFREHNIACASSAQQQGENEEVYTPDNSESIAPAIGETVLPETELP